MNVLPAATIALLLTIATAGCRTNKLDFASLKPVATKNVGNLSLMLASETGDLKQGPNDFMLQLRDPGGQPVDVGQVQLGSSMTMPGMAPMSGNAEIIPTGQPGTYRVKSNFAMSGAWHFTVSWNGPRGEGSATFNSNVR